MSKDQFMVRSHFSFTYLNLLELGMADLERRMLPAAARKILFTPKARNVLECGYRTIRKCSGIE